jgi:mRNA-degrading endonuclease RelE of RelBE toxin-antitoxin system
MMSDRFEVEFTSNAKKDVKDLRHDRERALREILRLQDDPQAGHTLRGSLRGARSLEFSLKGGGAYRAVYTIVDLRRVCIIFVVGPHENIYKVAERRYAALTKSLG